MGKEKQLTLTKIYLVVKTTLVTTQKGVIPLSMSGLQANRVPMAEHPLLETKIMATTRKNVMIGDGHVPRVNMATITKVFDQKDTGMTVVGMK